MSLLNLLTRLEKLDIKLELEGNQLGVDAPKGALTADLVQELKEKKEKIIRFLQEKVKSQSKFKSIEPLEKMDFYDQSSAQKRLYFLQYYDPESTVFNIIQKIEFSEHTEVKKIEDAIKKLIQRHEALRTSFHMQEDAAVQKVHDQFEFQTWYFEEEVLPEKTDHKELKDFFRSFDLSRPPLFRAALITAKNKNPGLVLVMHHIIIDALAYQVLKKDFITLYNGGELPPLRLQYKDYSGWQHGQAEKGRLKQQEEYWLKEFEGEIPVLNLPLDYERPGTRSFEGAVIGSRVGEEETGAMRQMAKDKGVTMFVLMLAIYNIFLAKICLQEVIIVGTPIAGRMHDDLEQVVGMFVNVLAIKNRVDQTKTFTEFLSQVKQKSLKNFENQSYQFEELVAKLGTDRVKGRNHLVETHFVYHDAQIGKPAGPDPKQNDNTRVIPEEFQNNSAHLDISFIVMEMETHLNCLIQYCTRLFKKKTIGKFSGYILNIINAVTKNPDVITSELDLLSEEEKDRITSHDPKNNDPFHQLKGVDINEIF